MLNAAFDHGWRLARKLLNSQFRQRLTQFWLCTTAEQWIGALGTSKVVPPPHARA